MGSASALSTSQINNFRLSIKMQMLRSLINYAAALQPHRMATLLLFAEGSLLRVAVSAIHEPLFWWFPLLVHEPRRNVVVFSMISSPILCPLLVHEPRRNVVVCTSIMKNLGKASDAKRPHCLNFFLPLRVLLRRDSFTDLFFFFFFFFFFSSAPSKLLTSSMTVS